MTVSPGAWALAGLAFCAGYGGCRLVADVYAEARRLWVMRKFRAAIREAITAADAEKASTAKPGRVGGLPS